MNSQPLIASSNPVVDPLNLPAEGRGPTASALASLPALPGSTEAPRFPSQRNSPTSRRWKWLRRFALLSALAGTAYAGFWYYQQQKPQVAVEELVPYKVTRKTLRFTIVQRGTLESADNREIVCRVKAGSKGGTFSTTIKWIIDDGTEVRKDAKLIELDDSALRDQRRTQEIAVAQARQAWEAAEQALTICRKQNESDISAAEVAIVLAQLDLDKYTGFQHRPLAVVGSGALLGLDTLNALAQEPLKGEFRQTLDEIRGRIKLAEADFEMWLDRTAWSDRMVKKGFVTPAQAQADRSRLDSARETLRKVQMELDVLQNFARPRNEKDLRSKLTEALAAFDRVKIQADAKERQAISEAETKHSIFKSEEAKLTEIDEQIKLCVIRAPQDGLVVYVQPESSRWGVGSNQSIIQQGEPVREGQKLMRIPDLNRMMVNMKIHESMVRNLRGDWIPTSEFANALEILSKAMMMTPFAHRTSWPLGAMVNDDDEIEYLRGRFRSVKGQPAKIRVDAFPDRILAGHVKSVATVATLDFASPDVKMFQVLVAVDDSVPSEAGRPQLKPGMSAEVTIELSDAAIPEVIAIPIESILGGPESGNKRQVYVQTSNGVELRDIEIGASNETLAEVKEGLKEGETIVLNPSALLKDARAKAKQTEREAEATRAKGRTGGSKAGMNGTPKTGTTNNPTGGGYKRP